MTTRRLLERLAALVRGRHLDNELDDEIAAHLELAEHDALARGLSPEEARREARLKFGGIDPMKEQHRDSRSVTWIDSALRDLRYGVSAIRRAPGFAAVVIGVLGLGIGANVAMFSVLDAALLRPIPFAHAERIAGVWEAPRPGAVNSTSVPDLLEWQRSATMFEALAAEQSISSALTGNGDPIRLTGKAVTADYFRVFQTPVALGRTFQTGEDQPGAPKVVVLSHAAWLSDFGADPNVLQRGVLLDGEVHQIIGVLATGPFDRDEARFWKPLVFTAEQRTLTTHWLTVTGRVRKDATIAQASDQMQAIHAAMTASRSKEERDASIVVRPIEQMLVGAGLRKAIAVGFGAVALVLLMACANVANLLLARGATRSKELAVRAALGASRGRLVTQLLLESLVLCLAGAAAGIAVASSLLQLAKPILADMLPFTAEVRLDIRALVFALVAALGVTLLAGTIPAIRITFGNLAERMTAQSRGASGSHSRARRLLVAGEVALSLVLVAGAMLLLRSLLRLESLPTGVRVDGVTTMSIDLPEGTYRTPEQAAVFYRTTVEKLRASASIGGAAIATALPLEWITNGEAMLVPGIDRPVRVRMKRVDESYLSVLEIPVIAGRGITNRDVAGSPRVVLINEALAAQLSAVAGWRNPVGKVARVSCPGYAGHAFSLEEREIIGVIRSERAASVGAPDPAVVYIPLAQQPSEQVKLFVSPRIAGGSVMPAVREAMREVDPRLPLGDIATMEQVRSRGLSGATRPAGVIGFFAAIAMLLAGIGLYGVISHAVTQQRREIGIRMALGARSIDVLRGVLGNALRLVIAGLVIGMVGVVALTRVLRGMLYEVSTLDPLALTAACVAMTLIGACAAMVPAGRAAAVDPVTTLRDEG